MKKSKRTIGLVLSLLLVLNMLPLSSVNASAAFSGTLQFDNEGKFTVMQISDIQDNASVDGTVISMITKAIARYSPDLVVFTGDNVTGNLTNSGFQSSVNEFLAPLLNTNTKFAVTFGNHDAEGISPSKQTQYNYYISKGGNNAVDFDVPALTGAGNGVIPIYPFGQTSGAPAFQLYLMDSGDDASSGYDCVYGDQIDYYIQRSITYPTVPSLWFMHIPVIEYYTEGMNKVPSGTAGAIKGNGSPWSNDYWALPASKIDWSKSGGTTVSEIYKEPPCPANKSTYESTAHRSSAAYGSLTNYQAWVNYGNMLGCYVGHDHKNSYVVTTDQGIDLGYAKSATLNSYNDGNPGLRVYELDSDGTYTTRAVTNNDLQYNIGDYTAVNNAIAASSFSKDGTRYYRANNINDPAYFNASSTTIGIGIYDKSFYEDNATDLGNAIDAVIFGLDTRYQAAIDAYASSISSAWQALILKTADYTAVNQNMANTNSSAIIAPPFYNATHGGQWLPRGYYTNTTLAAWDSAYNAIVKDLKLPSQTTVNGYASALASAHQALRLRSDIGYIVEYVCNGVKIAADKIVSGRIVGTIATETFQTIPSFDYLPDIGDVDGTKSITLGLTDNVITFNYSGNVNVTYKVEHYQQNVALNGYTKHQTETIVGIISSTVNAVPIGYSGFTYNSAVPGTVSSGTVAGDGSLTLKIYYTRNSYNLTFNANGGIGGSNSTVVFGSSITPPAVSKTGYTFMGWSPSVPSTVPANNTTYTAQWQVNHYTITFDANGGSGGSTGSMSFGSALNAPDLYRQGFTFNGWSPAVPAAVPAVDTTYTAVWQRNSYTIIFDANEGVGGTSSSMLFGDTLVPPTVTREGYDFVTWFPEVPSTVPAANTTYVALWGLQTFTITFDANGGTGGGSLQTLVTGEHLDAPLVLRTGYTFLGWEPEVPPVVPSENVTYTAQWSRNYYTITFNANGGVGGTTEVLGYGEKLAPPEVTKPGSTFAGWTPVVPSEVPAENITFTAHWSLDSSLITFDANGGEGGTSSNMVFGADLIAPNVMRTGYTLIGWEPALPAVVPAVSTTYTAIWSINNYNITFDDNGGSGGSTSSRVYGSPLSAPNISKPGFTFVEWSPAVPETVPAANTVYTAQWIPTNYTVTFDANGGTGGTTASLPFGSALKAPLVQRSGYTFAGWSPSVPVSVPIGNSTYTAQWTINSYTIVFDANSGEGGTNGSYVFGSPLIAPIVTRQGYAFAGWDPEVPPAVPSGNATYVAIWSQNAYTITFDANGGIGGKVETKVFGASLTAPVVTKQGYTFAGWLPDVPALTPDSDAVYTAQWTVNRYSLIFNANGGTGGISTTLAFETPINVPVVNRHGYSFTGWSAEVPATMPDQALQFTANWIPNIHDAVFIVNANEYSRTPTAYGSPIERPVDPVKAGSIFLGWDPGIPSSMPDEEVVFTAVWYEMSFSVTFNLNGGTGTVPSPQTVTVGSGVNLPAQGDISRDGYMFIGWALSPIAVQPLSSYSVDNGNTVLYAVWTQGSGGLLAKQGATTVVEQETGLIYGLETNITKDEFENNFITLTGDCRIVYSPDTDILGTGTKIEVVDNDSNTTLQVFYIVIFGDVNGDGNIDSTDAGRLIDYENYVFNWPEESSFVFRKAGDLNNDGTLDSLDSGLIVDVENYIQILSQVTGVT